MAANQAMGSPVLAQPPPPLPNDPSISNTLTNYLMQFSLWCRRGFAAKMNVGAPVSGIMFQAFDAPAGTVPGIWLLRIRSNGQFDTSPVTPGGPNPGPSIVPESPT